jgi:hypothetical protein
MKKMIFAIVMLLTTSAFANVGVLDGKSYCRTVVSGGVFGQPVGKRQHCVSFSNGIAVDDANTFFGNPPEQAAYQVSGNDIVFGSSEYTISADGLTLVTVSGSAAEGTVLTLQ